MNICINIKSVWLSFRIYLLIKWCHSDRKKTRGGGVALTYNSDIKCTEKSRAEDNDMEYLWCILSVAYRTIHYAVIYRPPSGSQSKFREKIIALLEDIDSNNADIVITGDFNIHMDNQQSCDSYNLSQILSDFGLISHVNGPTYIAGHTLNLFITRKYAGLVKIVRTDDIISDHLMVWFTLSFRLR